MENLTKSEIEIMRVLWEEEGLTPNEILEKIPRDIKNATLRKMLMILMEKGHVKRTKLGRGFCYHAVTRKENAFKKMANRLADVFCGGSPTILISKLMEIENLSEADIEALRKRANLEEPKPSRTIGKGPK